MFAVTHFNEPISNVVAIGSDVDFACLHVILLYAPRPFGPRQVYLTPHCEGKEVPGGLIRPLFTTPAGGATFPVTTGTLMLERHFPEFGRVPIQFDSLETVTHWRGKRSKAPASFSPMQEGLSACWALLKSGSGDVMLGAVRAYLPAGLSPFSGLPGNHTGRLGENASGCPEHVSTGPFTSGDIAGRAPGPEA